ncbi:MAG: phosphoribosyltransferase family protein [Azoarcus sp.]|nr:phosphoribosyltransferase family protein [Azoarcus sp.]
MSRSDFAPEKLFSFAARNNPKRAFLFLSHVLGKHLPVSPQQMQDIHERIASRITELPGPVIFAGMAETATCLGQGVFEAWLRIHRRTDGIYLQTTRYRIEGSAPIRFEETHSHAPNQWLFQPDTPAQRTLLSEARSLVLVDDEISTGNTFINLTRALRTVAPGLTHVHLSSITDFTGKIRSSMLQNAFEANLSTGALLEGEWKFESNNRPVSSNEIVSQSAQTPSLNDGGFGRCGRDSALTVPEQLVSELAAMIEPHHRVLVLGTGEFMHPPFVLARSLACATGAQVFMHATTRSPILCWGPIRHMLTFPDNYREGIFNYLYNHEPDRYDYIFLCHETPVSASLKQIATLLHAQLIHFRSESSVEKISVH